MHVASLRSRPLIARWWYALKPASWPKLLVPIGLGLGLGLGADGGEPRLAAVPWALLYTVAVLAFVVLLNDWGDRRVDAVKRSMFPDDCSPKTIPDRLLPGRYLLVAGLVAMAVAVGLAVVGAVLLGRGVLGVVAAAAPLIFVAYTLPPVKLNYRGGGELLEMLGVGIVLPLIGLLAAGGVGALQGAHSLVRLGVVLGGYAALAFSSAVASGLADEVSDEVGGKRTFATELGQRRARAVAAAAVAIAGAVWLVAGLAWLLLDDAPAGSTYFAVGFVALARADRLRRLGRLGTGDLRDPDEFRVVAAFKQVLHSSIQGLGLVLAVMACLGVV